MKNSRGRRLTAAAFLVALAVLCQLMAFVSAREDGRYYTEAVRVEVYAEPVAVADMYTAILVISAVWAVLLPPFRRLRRESRYLARIPAEAALGVMIVVSAAQELCISVGRAYIRSDGFYLLEWCGLFVLLFLLFGAWVTAVMVFAQILDIGPVWFFRERCILVRSGKRIRQAVASFIASLKEVDLSEKSDRWILKIVGANLAILFLCSILWYWGIAALLIYSAVLFFVLRRYMEQVKKNYGALLKATNQMAEGNLQVEIAEDLGLFEPFKAELYKIQMGFKKAVEEEVKSQNMKTELITNVSHDLKTPLTAIITYVNLLKDESITPEERRGYVEILDRKSLRLKKLIEDLFEVSKAASGNIKLDKQPVDLAEMVRQAAWEQESAMQAAGLELRMSVPEEKVVLELDGEKTYRVMENLLVNAVKYALAGTRVWLNLDVNEQRAWIVLKNISAMELEDDVSRLTDRFTRGDKSRNTEGSGLGLAIVKSFVELQGGTFSIEVDGDLFKAIVQFPKG